jgi:CRP-like cAMP-binding protein
MDLCPSEDGMPHPQPATAIRSDAAVHRPPLAPGLDRGIAAPSRKDASRAALLEAIRPFGLTTSYRRGAQIFRHGDGAGHWYWLGFGAVQLCSFAEDGRRHTAELILPGDLFGFEEATTRATTAEAVRDAVVVAFPRARAEATVDADPRLARALREVACDRLRAAQVRLVRLGRMGAVARVASFLLEMAERRRSCEAAPVELPITRDEIGAYLGLNSETVSRALTALRRRGAIELPARKSIRLLDCSALEAEEGGL